MKSTINFKGIFILISLVIGLFLIISIPFLSIYIYQYSHPIINKNYYYINKVKIDSVEIQEEYGAHQMEATYIYWFESQNLSISSKKQDIFNPINPFPRTIDNYLKKSKDSIFLWKVDEEPYKFSFSNQDKMNINDENKNLKLAIMILIAELLISFLTFKLFNKYLQ